MDNKRRLTNKYILLAILLIAVFVLPSCRTRITNNSEVSNIQYDEDGFLTETYEMRRQELGLSTAERPLLPNFGSGDTDSNDDFSEGESIEYNPEDYQEDFTEPETTTNTNTNTTSGTTTRRTTSPVSRSRTSGTTSSSSKYTVTFDSDGGTPKKQKLTFKKNAKIKFPSKTPTKDGYTFVEWRTAPDGEGSKITSDLKVNKTQTVYAHWKKAEKKPTPQPQPQPKPQPQPEPEPKPDPEPKPSETYKVTLIGDGDKTEEINVGTAYSLPSISPKTGYTASWNTKSDGKGTQYKPGDTVSSEITLYAIWQKKESELYWDDVLEEAKREKKDDNVDCFIIGSEKQKKLVTSCVATSVDKEDEPIFVILFVDDINNPTEGELAKIPEELSTITTYLVGKDATNDNNALLNKIVLMNRLHETGIPEDEAEEELGATILVK